MSKWGMGEGQRPHPYRPNVIVDSGAFTVWTQGGAIDRDEYCDYLLENADEIEWPVNLDVLPGKKGQPRTPAQSEKAARGSFENALWLRDNGVENIVPVVHQGESLEWLKRNVEAGFERIGLSPNKDLNTAQKGQWLDQCFYFLCGNGGYPPIRLHAFGETSRRILFAYPWASVDSSSWVLVGGMGNVLVPPRAEDGSYAFDQPPIILPISVGLDGATNRMRKGRRFLGAMGRERRKYIEGYFEWAKLPTDLLETDDIARKRLNIHYFKHVVAAHRRRPFRVREGGFWIKRVEPVGVEEWLFEPEMDFAFVTSGGLGSNMFMVLVERCQTILLSYHYIKKERNVWDYINDPPWFVKKMYTGRTGSPFKRFRRSEV